MYLGKLISGNRYPLIEYWSDDDLLRRSIHVNIFGHWFVWWLPERRLKKTESEREEG